MGVLVSRRLYEKLSADSPIDDYQLKKGISMIKYAKGPVSYLYNDVNPHSPYGARHLLPLIYITIYK